jgi:hypothetical protein
MKATQEEAEDEIQQETPEPKVKQEIVGARSSARRKRG